jgi:hypothetical protein
VVVKPAWPVVAIAAILACARPGVAGEGSTDGPAERRTGLEFGIGESFRLDPLRGASISWKRYDGRGDAWRVGLSPRFELHRTSSDWDWNREVRYGLEIEAQRLWYLESRSRARPYWGLGPVARAHRYSLDQYYQATVGESSRWTTVQTTYEAGVAGTVGAEFLIAGRVLLGAEYSLAATWQRTNRREQTPGLFHHQYSWQATSTTYTLQPRGATLVLGILF